MADRRPFIQKYSSLSKHWNVNGETVSFFLNQYDERLKQENERLKTQPFTIDKYFWDRRNTSEYLYDLIDAWLIEDLIANLWLKQRLNERNKNISIQLNGTDRNRLVEKKVNEKISTQPDIMLDWDSGFQPVELQMARRELKEGYDMKETKVKHAISFGSVFLWIILPRAEFFIVNPLNNLKDIAPFENKAWGGKRVYRISHERIKQMGCHNMNEVFTDAVFRKLGVR